MIYIISTDSFGSEFLEKAEKAERIIFDAEAIKGKKEFNIYGRILLGFMLKTHYGIKKISYNYGEYGKPYLKNENLFFNISHSGHYVVCCVSENEIGCDIEKINKYNNKISERFFTAKEKDVLLHHDNKERAFTRLWTLKESVLKKDGTGINGGLDSYCFADKTYDESFEAYSCNFLCRSFCEYELSVCSSEKYKSEDIRFVTDDELEGFINELNLKNA